MVANRNDAAAALRLAITKGDPRRGIEVQHTLGHVDCPACSESRAMFVRTISASMSFAEASECFLELLTVPAICGSARFLGERTLEDYEAYARRLNIFFGALRLDQIHIGHLIEYQQRRLKGEGFTAMRGKVEVVSPAGPKKTNQELGLLQRILEMAGCWSGELEIYYRRFQQPDADIPRALSYEQQQHLLCVMASRPEWEFLYCYSLVASHTCFSSDELRTIRQGDINLTHGILGVNPVHGKNRYRRRVIELTDGACIWALEKMLARAQRLNCAGPHLYLMPSRRVRNNFDGTKPMGVSGLYKPFGVARDLALLEWFCLNGWRHTAITRLAEAGTPIAVIQARAGHRLGDARMTQHYTQISEAARRMWMEQAAERKPVHSVRDIGEARRAVGRASA